MRESTRVVIPHRGLDHGKTRLSGMLGPAGRATLSAAMLRSVATACRRAAKNVLVVSPDPQLHGIARELGIGFALQRGLGMNAALAQAREDAATDGVTRLAAVSADLPDLLPADIDALLEAVDANEPSVVIAPDRAGSGTNALILQPLFVIAFRFGHKSRWAHVDEARSASVAPTIVDRPGLAFDIDFPADLASWRSRSDRSGTLTTALERPDQEGAANQPVMADTSSGGP
ncbi:MAG TPA: 2-phospho-L-lactate guanylyltransferase [Candidatus Limnocylindria bacterium]